MRNFFVLFYLFLSSLMSLFGDNANLWTNLLIISITRGLYIFTFYLKYIRFNESKENDLLFSSRKELIYFISKNIAVILLGTMILYFALFFATYSVLIAGRYLISEKIQESRSLLSKIGFYLEKYAPLAFVIVYFILFDLIAIAFVIFGYLLYLYWGKNYANLSYEELIARYKKRRFMRLPLFYQILIMVLLVSPSIVFFLLFSVFRFSMVDMTLEFFLYLFNPFLLISVNFPIALVSRVIYLLAIRYNFLMNETEQGIDKPLLKFSKNQKRYFILTNLIIVSLGTLVIYFALFTAVYSLLIAFTYFNNYYKLKKVNLFNILRILSLMLIAVAFLIPFFAYYDPLGIFPLIIFAALGVGAYLIKYINTIQFTFTDYLRNLNQRFMRKSPNALQIFAIGWLIIVPMIFILGINIYGVTHKETVMIKMRDGTKLSTNIYYSPLAWNIFTNEPEEAPVILIRTPYNKDAVGMDFYAELYLSMGYHVVFQDLRNTFASEGKSTDLMFASSYTDGVDTIQWILDKEWCDGNIGSVGASALSINTFMYAGMDGAYDDDKGLKCQTHMFGLPDLYLDGIVMGAFRYHLVVEWIENTAPNNYRYQLDTIFDLIDSQDTTNKAYLATTLNAGENNWSNVNCAGLHVVGWHDVFLSGGLRGFKGYDDNGTKNARGRQALIIGPWTHGAFYTTQQGQLNYPQNSFALGMILDWEEKIFNEALKGEKNDALWEKDRVAYYVMGDPDDEDANYWKYTDDWPLNFAENEWYFGIDDEGDNILVDDSNDLAKPQNFSYLYDPLDPCPTIGGNNLGRAGDYGPGPYDQSAKIEREDTVLFKSKTLKSAYTTEGDLKVRLHFASNCSDTDFMVHLLDVYPDGRHMNIIDGARMARLRKSYFSQNFLTAGQEYNMTIDLAATAYRFDEGHQIGVLVTSSNFPRFAANTNTGGSITEHYSKGVIANNTIVTGPGKSCIIFPELKY